MPKLFYLVLMGLGLSITASAQSDELIVQNESNKLFLIHTVAPKENWYSIGRLFNISPKEIAPFNGTEITRPLSIGEHLKIPLTATNFSQNGQKTADETFVPVYHIIAEKEWLFHISSTHNNVPVESLEKWNHIKKEQAKTGMHLIVGYLKVKPALSALASGAKEQVTAVTETKQPDNKPADNPQPVVVKEEKKTTPPVTQPKTYAPVNKPSSNAINTSNTKTTGGYFAPDYTNGGNNATGMAGTFKSTSGWQDGKYYALMNNVPVGTI
ncbi:MAG: LysM peptidoglycan-binding domain-containing protein, partial [Bacteroidetes bacterium]|nr:LysM peptidoglycan-binding domain-containing protein [Bacteroidota bacterium]